MADTPSRADVEASVLACTACQLHRVGSGPIHLRGNSDSGVVVVGEAPGRVEDERREPFVGPSGEKLMEWLTTAGLPANQIAFMNAVSCFPNRTPTGQEVTACRENLDAQLLAVRPSLLLLFGGVAISSWWSDMRIGEIRGHYWQARVNGWTLTPVATATWHPAAVLRNHTLEEQAIMDLMLAKAFLDGDYDPDDDKGCVKCGAREDLVYIGPDERPVRSSEYGVPFCQKHWAFRSGTGGKGRPATPRKQAAKRVAKPKTEKMF